MRRIHSWIPALVAAVAFGGVVIACSDEVRVTSSGDDAGEPNPTPTSTSDAPADRPPPSHKPPFDPADESVSCTGEPCVVELVAGDAHFCARMKNGAVRCWGANGFGVLGRAPSADDAASVSTVEGLTNAQQLSTSGTTACALLEGGAVQCWGNNSDALLGLEADAVVSDGAPHPMPAPVALPGPAVRVDIGPRVGCAVLATGQTWCWGFNGRAQLGRPTTGTLGQPALAPLSGLKAVRTAHGSYTSFAVTEEGDVVSWGTVGGPRANLSARTASTELDPNPLAIGLEDVTKLAVSSSNEYQAPGWPQPPLQVYGHACAVVRGEVYCWGLSEYASLGTGSPDLALRPTQAGIKSGQAWAQQVAVGVETTCVRLTDGSVQCAGDNRFGGLALGDDAGAKFSMAFRPATALTGPAVSVAATRSTVCALLKTGAVACWGANDAGQLGQGTKDDETHGTPVTVKL
jgi:alpha-tubulin suppressor-like RCC1 family protein